ncbi:hypothetical protein [Gloeothece verrucosa]|nr:hypothetical protein [Gloeothece verrucosa]
MSETTQKQPQEKQEQAQENAPVESSDNPQDTTVVVNPRELLENPAVAPPPLDPPEDLRVDLFKD